MAERLAKDRPLYFCLIKWIETHTFASKEFQAQAEKLLLESIDDELEKSAIPDPNLLQLPTSDSWAMKEINNKVFFSFLFFS